MKRRTGQRVRRFLEENRAWWVLTFSTSSVLAIGLSELEGGGDEALTPLRSYLVILGVWSMATLLAMGIWCARPIPRLATFEREVVASVLLLLVGIPLLVLPLAVLAALVGAAAPRGLSFSMGEGDFGLVVGWLTGPSMAASLPAGLLVLRARGSRREPRVHLALVVAAFLVWFFREAFGGPLQAGAGVALPAILLVAAVVALPAFRSLYPRTLRAEPVLGAASPTSSEPPTWSQARR